MDDITKKMVANQNIHLAQEQINNLVQLYSQGYLKHALEQTSKLLNQFPNSVTLFNLQGASNAGLQNFDAAIESYEKAIKIKPNFAEAYNNMGVSLQSKDDLIGAIESYKEAIKIKPNYAEAYFRLGKALLDQGKQLEALNVYKNALYKLAKVYEHPIAFYRRQI